MLKVMLRTTISISKVTCVVAMLAMIVLNYQLACTGGGRVKSFANKLNLALKNCRKVEGADENPK